MAAPTPSSAPRYRIVLAFGCVYAFWGATYTAARFGVHLVPAPLLAGTRLCIGGALMLAFNRLRGQRLWGSPATMRRLFLLGVLLLFTGNVGLVWSEFYLPSGFSALLVAIVPVYVAILEMLLPDGERLRTSGQLGLVLGFLGLFILAYPSAHTGMHGDRQQIFAIGVLLLGALSFACGSILSRHSRLPLDPLVCAGWEMLVAGVCDLTLGTALHDWRYAQWNKDSISAIAYLIVFGSLMGFSSYIWLLKNVPVAKVATYAYVNPMVAVLLGAMLLGEHLAAYEWAGMAAILVAVFLVTSSKVDRADPARPMEQTSAETEVC